MSEPKEEGEAPWALVGNAADAEQVKKAEKKELRGRDMELNDWTATFDTPQRRRTLRKILAYCGIHRTVFGATDAWTNFNAGKQDVGHYIEAQILEADPSIFTQATLEDRADKAKR